MRRAKRRHFRLFVGCLALSVATAGAEAFGSSEQTAGVKDIQKRLLAIADDLLEQANVSYVYGGYQLGDSEACRLCNECLDAKAPTPSQRLGKCPVCKNCSLDCSHFTELVYRGAGLAYPYIETARMLSLSPAALARHYGLIDVGVDHTRALAGDLLVYKGHVVILERLHDPKLTGGRGIVGDVIHATGGRDIKGPGQGIQRERFVDPSRFRGPLLRILRHRAIHDGYLARVPSPAKSATTPSLGPTQQGQKLRPVERRDDHES